MAPSSILRAALRARPAAAFRPLRSTAVARPVIASFSTSSVSKASDPHDPHHEETFEEFTARYAKGDDLENTGICEVKNVGIRRWDDE